MSFKDFLFLAMVAILFSGVEPLDNLKMRNAKYLKF